MRVGPSSEANSALLAARPTFGGLRGSNSILPTASVEARKFAMKSRYCPFEFLISLIRSLVAITCAVLLVPGDPGLLAVAMQQPAGEQEAAQLSPRQVSNDLHESPPLLPWVPKFLP